MKEKGSGKAKWVPKEIRKMRYNREERKKLRRTDGNWRDVKTNKIRR